MATFETARFALSKFYRLTFRPLDSCEHFPLRASGLKNPRRRFEDAHFYGEAAIQLWYNDYSPETAESHLKEARSLLEASIAGGFKNARNIVALAFVRAILDGPEEGNTVLSSLSANPSQLWTHALRIASQDPDLLIDRGFVLGINRGAVWTLLGTYAARFMNDTELAEILYRAAVRLNRHNAIASTNLARFLLRHGGRESLNEARRLLQTAQQFSDRRFGWWRAVAEEVNTALHGGAPTTVKSPKLPARPMPAHFANLKDIRTRFKQLDVLVDAQQRGYELEILLYEIARLTFDAAAPPYRVQRGPTGITQIDGYFEHHGEKYRVECKWTQSGVLPADVAALVDKIDVVCQRRDKTTAIPPVL